MTRIDRDTSFMKPVIGYPSGPGEAGLGAFPVICGFERK